MPIIRYNPKLKILARKLRNNSTVAEIILWKQLSNGKLNGFDFHRQKPIDNFIVDFFCPKLMLAIEIDGESHFDKIKYDEDRDRQLKKIGIQVLHFGDNEVKEDASAVIEEIKDWIKFNTGKP